MTALCFYNLVCIYLLLQSGLCFSKGHRHADSLVARVKQAVHHVMRKNHPHANVGIVVQAMDNLQLLYQKNADHVFSPASTLKLFTSVAALIELGPSFTFSTQLIAKTSTVSRQGDLYSDVAFVFDGDPTLSLDDLSFLISSLGEQGVRRIRGRIYIDDKRFGPVAYAPGWMWDELNACYAAPVTGVILNKNCFEFILVPGQKKGDLAVARQPQSQRFTPVMSVVKTASQGTHCSLVVQASALNTYRIEGCVDAERPVKTVSVAVKNPHHYVKQWVRFFLEQNHIHWHGKIQIGSPPKSLNIPLATHHSAPLSELIETLLKKSDNLIANAIYKRLGAHYFNHDHITWQQSAQAVEATLTKKAGIDFSHIHLVDGAGLSRYNLVQPQQLAKLLAYIYHTPTIYRYIFPALPIAGVDGTLENRLTSLPRAGQIHAKTGTMTSGSSLAGYIQTLSKRPIAFVIVINGFTEKHTVYEKLEDAISLALAKL